MVAERRDPPAMPRGRVDRLEKELAQVKRERDQLLADERMAEWRDQRWRVNILGRECRKLQSQRDQLREALEELLETCHATERGYNQRQQARAALKQTEKTNGRN